MLIKAVLQSIPTYIMSCFKLPGYLFNSIEKAIRQFWWGSAATRGMAWSSSGPLCRSKAQGGLGFRDLRSFNLALLEKQCWRLITYPDSLLGRILQARYFSNTSFFEAETGGRPSATWRSILLVGPFFQEGLRVRIGNSFSTTIWHNAWVKEDGNFRVITPQTPASFFPFKVADLIDPMTGTWDREMLERTFWPVDHSLVLSTPTGGPSMDDLLVWHYSKDGRFTVRSCYHLIMQRSGMFEAAEEGSSSGVTQVEWKAIWRLKLPPRVRMFIWRACMGIIPHSVELYRRHIALNPFCAHYGIEAESSFHVFMECRCADLEI